MSQSSKMLACMCRSILASFPDLDDVMNHEHLALQYKAVVLQDKGVLRAHFPDLTGSLSSDRESLRRHLF